MAKHNEIGNLGENLAVAYLEKENFLILHRNWRFSRAEIDIVAKEDDVLIFVEVKTRTNISFGKPESFVTAKKENFMFEAANVYMEKFNHDWEIRFDIISITFDKQMIPDIKHIKDAFFPGLA